MIRRPHRQIRSQLVATAPQCGLAEPEIEVRPVDKPGKKLLRCAIYTRKSTEHNLDLEFNSLDAQREACEAYRGMI